MRKTETPFANEAKAFADLEARVEALENRQVWATVIGVVAVFVLLLLR